MSRLTIYKLSPVVILILFIQLLTPVTAIGITIKEEEKLGQEFMQIIPMRYKLIQDPYITDYLNRIGQRIVSVLPAPPFTYHFYLVQEEVYNAFAAPGAHIFINSGLLAAMESEEELVGILAHEIAHVQSRHISQLIARSSKISLATMAGVIASVFLGVGGAVSAANAVAMGSVAAGRSVDLKYRREDEAQADKIGFYYLRKAGYNGEGIITVLKKIRSKKWFSDKEIPTYVMTHPGIDERINYMDTWLQSSKIQKDKRQISPSGDEAFDMAHVRLMALYENRDAALALFHQRLIHHPQDAIARYGLGLLASAGGHRQEAIKHLRKALNLHPFNSYFLSELGRLYYLDGRFTDAFSVLQSATRMDRFNSEGHLYLSRTLMALGRPHKAASLLEQLIIRKPDYVAALYSLGEAYGEMGVTGQSHYYLARYYKKKGELKAAYFHFGRTLKTAVDPILKQKSESQMEEIGKKLRKQREKDDAQKRRS